MDVPAFEATVRQALQDARDSLGRIEERVREEGDDPDLMAASRCYARFCLHAREFLGTVHARRPLPRRFGEQVRPLADALAARRDVLDPLQLRPGPDELRGLVRRAEALPERA